MARICFVHDDFGRLAHGATTSTGIAIPFTHKTRLPNIETLGDELRDHSQ
jgi:hypothetical protein